MPFQCKKPSAIPSAQPFGSSQSMLSSRMQGPVPQMPAAAQSCTTPLTTILQQHACYKSACWPQSSQELWGSAQYSWSGDA